MAGPKIFKIINQISQSLALLNRNVVALTGQQHGTQSGNLTRHPIHYLYDRAKKESAEFIYENLEHAVLFEEPHDLLRFSLTKMSQGAVWEFGVFTATSTNLIAQIIEPQTVTGFDSFQGLKENWVGHTLLEGTFDLKAKLPNVHANVELVAGWVQDTIFAELKKLNGKKISFVHFDLDTYESTRFTLEAITPHLSERTIFIFDEYHSYPGWLHGEKRAFEEWLSSCTASHKFIGFSREQAALEIRI